MPSTGETGGISSQVYGKVPPGNIKRADGRPDFDYLRRLYAAIGSDLVGSERWLDPYFADWPSIFTPIESQMWTLIRSQGVPFYPQYPVGGYFIDFANPRLKIGIECDSRGWHERRADLDLIRTQDLYDLGWLVFGFSGRACMRLPALPRLDEIASRWRASGHGKPLPTTRFDRVPPGWQDRYEGEFEVDMAQTSTFEWFGSSLVELVWEEERREMFPDDDDERKVD
jgi:very-short-patch-repair endonuclease